VADQVAAADDVSGGWSGGRLGWSSSAYRENEDVGVEVAHQELAGLAAEQVADALHALVPRPSVPQPV
jgi:hypothetical protein